ncbi:MAG: YtxH domain-containing protein [Nitrospira sp.]|nr:YtxH domain-containing protein [Nitrospira sp.]
MPNRTHRESSSETGWSGFLAGALIGGGVALLLAPQRGAELRGMLSDYASRASDDLMDKAEETWDAAVERGRDYYNKGEEVVQDAGRSASEFAQQGQEAVKNAGRSAQEFARHAQEDADRQTKG